MASLCLPLFVVCLNAQVVTSVGSGSGTAGTSVTLNIGISTSGSDQPSALQWIMSYPSADVTGVSIAAAGGATGSGKSLACTPSAQNITCVLYGVNQNAVPSGTIATATVQLAANPPDSVVPLQISSTVVSDADGEPIASSGAVGNITVTAALPQVGLMCTPTSINTPGTASCSVSLSSAAPAGFQVQIASNNAALTAPASVSFAAGSSSASFTATAAGVTTSQSATLTATGGSNAPSTTLSLLPEVTPAVSGLSCAASTLTTPGSIVCTVRLSGAAPQGGSKVTLLATGNIRVPSSITVAAGSTSATFTASAARVSQNEPAFVLAFNTKGWAYAQILLVP